jgi:hypothetical protein
MAALPCSFFSNGCLPFFVDWFSSQSSTLLLFSNGCRITLL